VVAVEERQQREDAARRVRAEPPRVVAVLVQLGRDARQLRGHLVLEVAHGTGRDERERAEKQVEGVVDEPLAPPRGRERLPADDLQAAARSLSSRSCAKMSCRLHFGLNPVAATKRLSLTVHGYLMKSIAPGGKG